MLTSDDSAFGRQGKSALRISLRVVAELLGAIIIGMTIVGCDDPFELREGEPPEDLPLWWNTPSTPQVLLDDLVKLYENQAPSLIGRLLAEEYLFTADPVDVPVGDVGFLDKVQEEEFSRALLDGTVETPSLVFSPDPERTDRIIEGVEATLYRHYILRVQDPSEDASGGQLLAEGEAVFDMVIGLSGTEWEVVSWRDEHGETEWSWGLLKIEILGGR